uniref:Uncharacterized protein n=1 Tax=Parascaris univalens TaxID=6257 RepID=A0A915AFE3_PARUN
MQQLSAAAHKKLQHSQTLKNCKHPYNTNEESRERNCVISHLTLRPSSVASLHVVVSYNLPNTRFSVPINFFPEERWMILSLARMILPASRSNHSDKPSRLFSLTAIETSSIV